MTGLRMVKLPSLASSPVEQPVSCAVTCTRASVAGVFGTLHRNEPEFAIAVAITFG